MPPEIWLYSLIRLAALVSVGAFTVLGMKVWFKHREARRNQIGAEDFERLAEAVESLHEQTAIMRDEFQDLHERIDFAERVLSQGTRDLRLEEPADTPV
jgi:hypothetical protein